MTSKYEWKRQFLEETSEHSYDGVKLHVMHVDRVPFQTLHLPLPFDADHRLQLGDWLCGGPITAGTRRGDPLLV